MGTAAVADHLLPNRCCQRIFWSDPSPARSIDPLTTNSPPFQPTRLLEDRTSTRPECVIHDRGVTGMRFRAHVAVEGQRCYRTLWYHLHARREQPFAPSLQSPNLMIGRDRPARLLYLLLPSPAAGSGGSRARSGSYPCARVRAGGRDKARAHARLNSVDLGPGAKITQSQS